mmetsp:Transcript_8888/g.16709  ORF Transcript_8888/g.16709 Transcript_8888/m.16709 type:complete len:219 (-) Transcript_8888:778-1434(-)
MAFFINFLGQTDSRIYWLLATNSFWIFALTNQTLRKSLESQSLQGLLLSRKKGCKKLRQIVQPRMFPSLAQRIGGMAMVHPLHRRYFPVGLYPRVDHQTVEQVGSVVKQCHHRLICQDLLALTGTGEVHPALREKGVKMAGALGTVLLPRSLNHATMETQSWTPTIRQFCVPIGKDLVARIAILVTDAFSLMAQKNFEKNNQKYKYFFIKPFKVSRPP